MPSLYGFSDNEFRTRGDLMRAALALLQPLEQYKSSGGARIKIETGTAAGFSESSSQLEGFARPLWVVGDLLRFRTIEPDATHFRSSGIDFDTWIKGLKTGTDPGSSEYWGDLSNVDQRMVEMESIAYTLLLNPDSLNFEDDPQARLNLVNWLRSINDYVMPQNNWLWFRVFTNLAIVKTLKVPLEEVREYIDASLQTLDSFYIGEGWSSDGVWGDARKQVDYYSGSFAIQFAQLLFVRFAPEYDMKRTERYKREAREFSTSFWRYFHENGAAIPFGRSLTYRFAFAAFWSAAAVAQVELPPPFSQLGSVKGMLLRHLRWWSTKPYIFNPDGTVNIGYCYPNMYLSENYNSPQSVFWCLKSFIVLGLPETHPFWTCEELPHPLKAMSGGEKIPEVAVLKPPRHIVCNTPEHHFLLSSGQSTGNKFKAREAKYAKFAYSSNFGFSVPVGPFLEQQCPDSTLAVSPVDEEQWKVRWDPSDAEWREMTVDGEKFPIIVSCWKPWLRQDLEIHTSLIPPLRKWPGWHLRIHQVKFKALAGEFPMQAIRIVDGGFAASAQSSLGLSIFEEKCQMIYGSSGDSTSEGWWNDKKSALVVSESGASGIRDLTGLLHGSKDAKLSGESKVIRADPNTNLMVPRTLIPAMEYHHSTTSDSSFEDGWQVAHFVTGVFAVENCHEDNLGNVWKLWTEHPYGKLELSKSGDTALIGT